MAVEARNGAVPPVVATFLNGAPPSSLGSLGRAKWLGIVTVQTRWELLASLSGRVAGTILVTLDDPWTALCLAVTAGITAPLFIVTRSTPEHETNALHAAGCECLPLGLGQGAMERIRSGLRSNPVARYDGTLFALLDPISHTVRKRDGVVHLTQIEFALLYCLSVSNGRAMEASALIREVIQRPGSVADDRQVLEYHISQLRRKMRRGGLGEAVETLRDFGYRLEKTLLLPNGEMRPRLNV